MSRTIRIEVEEYHIKLGCSCNRRLCPVKLAISETTGHQQIEVLREVWGNPFIFEGNLPPVAKDFIHNFDLHKPVSPIAFDLELPDNFEIKAMKV